MKITQETPTPRTDAAESRTGFKNTVLGPLCRTLERELAAANAKIAELEKKLHWTECQKINAEY